MRPCSVHVQNDAMRAGTYWPAYSRAFLVSSTSSAVVVAAPPPVEEAGRLRWLRPLAAETVGLQSVVTRRAKAEAWVGVREVVVGEDASQGGGVDGAAVFWRL